MAHKTNFTPTKFTKQLKSNVLRDPKKRKKKRAKSKVQAVKERLGGRVVPRKPRSY